ncbi:MAG: hypothetical protein ACHRXM_29120 [Isosphaerales bacterium]
MSQQELLRHAVTVLDKLGIDYMVIGSFASSMHGEPRMSHDIDLVVALTQESAEKLFHAFSEPDFYLSIQAIHEALQHRTMFNLLQPASGDKVDFWILTDEPFDTSRFARKRAEESAGILLKTSTPEDTILAKLRWTQQCGGSEKHFTDALRVFEL